MKRFALILAAVTVFYLAWIAFVFFHFSQETTTVITTWDIKTNGSVRIEDDGTTIIINGND